MIDLCTLIVVFGFLRCLVMGTSLEKQFSLIWGLMLLTVLLNSLNSCELNTELKDLEYDAGHSEYDELVTEKAEIVLEENITRVILSKYDISCEADVTLSYANDAVKVERVTVSGVGEIGYLREFLCDYLMVGDDVIDFT